MEQTVIIAFEIIGTLAFAISGAMVGIQRKMDLFGVWLLAVITAVGGGMTRDVLLGNVPPVMFRSPVYVLVASGTALIVFAFMYFQRIPFRENERVRKVYARVLSAFDSMGLGMFTVVGINTAVNMGHGANGFLLVTVGVITGVGGGILRDVLSASTPVVLRKQVYASASIIGAVVYLLLRPMMAEFMAMMAAVAVIMILRVLAEHYRWNLPVADKDKKQEKPR
ncbi:MAG: trimeric intracellular cation channel family protein [Clostridiales bacterium]|nr:trimeric intracellular cation channel family protein [Clostridiales bacterium]